MGLDNMTEKNIALTSVGNKLRQSADRAAKYSGNLSGMRPDPKEDNPIPLYEFSDACRTLDTEDLLPEKLEEMLMASIDAMTPYQIAHQYKTGKKFCLAVFPTDDLGVPFDRESMNGYQHFRLLKLEARGLTYGFGSIPGYYFRLLPTEIQEQCVFEPPQYKFGNFASPQEIIDLKEMMRQSFQNLKRLIVSGALN